MPFLADHVADKNHVELARLAKQYDFPSFVKQANLDQITSPRTRPDTVYADPVRKQYPCDSAASTWLSVLYYQEKRAEFHPKDRVHIERLLTQYVDYWGIKAACEAVRSRWADLHKNAEAQLPDTEFAYVFVDEQGRKDRHLRMKTAAEVKAAAEYVLEHRDKFPFTIRHTMSKKILEKAARLGAAISSEREFLEKQAGMGVCDPTEVVRMIEDRARRVKNDTVRTEFFKIAKFVKDTPRKALQPEALVKLADTIDQLDRRLNFVGMYQEGLPRPEEVIFKATFSKAASAMVEHVFTTSGKGYEKSAFKKLALPDVQALLGDEFADRVKTALGDVDPEKMAEEVATLPRPDAEMLDSLLSDHGIAPVMTKAAEARQGFNKAEMEAWASAYATVK